jgi:Zn-dependent peptidase ImmA (M78 family)
MIIEQIFDDERERKVLRETMEKLGISAEATVRYLCRIGQLVDHQTRQGYKLAWVKDGEVVDPLDLGPKRAPTGGGHVDCPCWITGSFKRTEGCRFHPYDL